MPPVIVLDVNETLLDLAPVRQWFSDRYAGTASAADWFAELLRVSFVSSITDRYEPFPSLARSALTTVVGSAGLPPPSADDLGHIGSILESLPPHADVLPGLETLTGAGFRVAALTNSPLETAERQLANAGIARLVDPIMSVDMVRRFKPHRSVYLAAAERLQVSPSGLAMVAAHDWDIAGAMAVGAHGVFIARSGTRYSGSFPEPTLTAPNIERAAGMILDGSLG